LIKEKIDDFLFYYWMLKRKEKKRKEKKRKRLKSQSKLLNAVNIYTV